MLKSKDYLSISSFLCFFSLKETLHDPRGSSESRKSELVAERERVREEVQKKEEDLEGKVERTNNLYFEILQQVRGDERRQSSSALSLRFYHCVKAQAL